MLFSIMKAVKRPIPVEVIQITDDNCSDVIEYINNKTNEDTIYYKNGNIYINTLEGAHMCHMEDYIIRGVNGEYYPCKKEIFEKTYDIVSLECVNQNEGK